jgi:parvulin-like peptidyl-prolyl isomerase
MKLKIFLSAALAAGVISARAATANVSTVSTTNAAAAPDAMTALFGDPVIAKGSGFQIKRSELDQMVSAIKSRAMMQGQGQQLTPQEIDQISVNILERLIAYQVLLQKATPEDRAAGQKDADTQFDKLIKQAVSQENLERQLKSEGMTLADLKAKGVQEATANIVLKRTLSVNITDAQIREAYSNHEAAFEMPETVHARHILLMTIDPETGAPLSTNAVAAKRKQIDDILKRAQSGEDFAALAKQYSEDPRTKAEGGELSPFARGQLPIVEVESATFALKPGQLSDVVTSMYGFHIIKLIEKTPAKKYGLLENIPQIDRTPASICKDQLESEQIAKQAPALVQKLRDEQKVEVVDMNLKSLEQSMQAETTNAPAGGLNQ